VDKANKIVFKYSSKVHNIACVRRAVTYTKLYN